MTVNDTVTVIICLWGLLSKFPTGVSVPESGIDTGSTAFSGANLGLIEFIFFWISKHQLSLLQHSCPDTHSFNNSSHCSKLHPHPAPPVHALPLFLSVVDSVVQGTVGGLRFQKATGVYNPWPGVTKWRSCIKCAPFAYSQARLASDISFSKSAKGACAFAVKNKLER